MGVDTTLTPIEFLLPLLLASRLFLTFLKSSTRRHQKHLSITKSKNLENRGQADLNRPPSANRKA